jgi:hypothetical protein
MRRLALLGLIWLIPVGAAVGVGAALATRPPAAPAPAAVGAATPSFLCQDAMLRRRQAEQALMTLTAPTGGGSEALASYAIGRARDAAIDARATAVADIARYC